MPSTFPPKTHTAPLRPHTPRHHHVCDVCKQAIPAWTPCLWASTDKGDGTWTYHYLHTACAATPTDHLF